MQDPGKSDLTFQLWHGVVGEIFIFDLLKIFKDYIIIVQKIIW